MKNIFPFTWLTGISDVSHPLHILETKFMFEHVHIRYCNTIGWWLIISFTSMTDISDFIHPLNRGHVWSCSGKTILVDHVQVRLYWKFHVKDRIASCFIYSYIRHAMILASLMNDFKTFKLVFILSLIVYIMIRL